MKLEVQWLAYLATQAGILDSAKCLVLKHALGPDADILSCGEKLYDRGYCSDFERLQELVAEAYQNAEDGKPVPENPFDIFHSSSTRLSSVSRRPSVSLKNGSQKPSLDPAREDPAAPPPPPELEDGNNGAETDAPAIPGPDTAHPFISRRPQTLSPTPTREEPEPHPSDHPDFHGQRPKISMRRTAATTSTAEKPPASRNQTNPPAETFAQPSQPHAQNPPPATPPPTPRLSRTTPEVSLSVKDDWPDFERIASLPDEPTRQFLVQLLLKSQTEGASDVHLCADARPFIRRNREMEYLSHHLLTAEEANKLNQALLSEQQRYDFAQNHDLDFALALNLQYRFRVNLMQHKDGTSGTYRLIPAEVKSLEELGFTACETIKKLLTYHNGLIMVTGPLGSGKTATLAALVDELNRHRQDHLITVESPIEIVQHSNQCHITQREVGSHTKTFHSALKGALRQDPDIIVIGEMRDLETVEMALSASETGHLVIGTMHTSDAGNTLNRLLDVFPASQQTQIRSMVAESLKGIICQRLLPSTQGGVELAYELLLNNAAVGNLIRTNKADGLANIIETGRREGMVLMDKSIFALWEAGRISDEVALKNLISRPMKEQIRQSGTAAVSA